MENGLNASDVALLSRDNGGGFGFGNDGAWIFGLLVLLGLFNGGFGGFGGGERNATGGDVQRATDFAALERQNNEGVAATRQAAYDVTGAVKDGNYNILGELRDVQAITSAGFAGLQKCCCDELRAIDSVNYNGAINTASINATTTAQTQKNFGCACRKSYGRYAKPDQPVTATGGIVWSAAHVSVWLCGCP